MPSAPPPRRVLAVVGATAGVGFVALTMLVAAGVTQSIDDRAAAALSDRMRAQLAGPTKIALHLFDPRISIGLVILFGTITFAITSHSRHLVRAVALVGTWSAITIGLKDVLNRPLPQAGTWAYPSGHVGGTVVVCAVVGLALVEFLPPSLRRVAVIVVVAVPITLAVLLVGRGSHWLTDVVGGALLALACVAAIELLVVRGVRTARRGHNESDGDRDAVMPIGAPATTAGTPRAMAPHSDPPPNARSSMAI